MVGYDTYAVHAYVYIECACSNVLPMTSCKKYVSSHHSTIGILRHYSMDIASAENNFGGETRYTDLAGATMYTCSYKPQRYRM